MRLRPLLAVLTPLMLGVTSALASPAADLAADLAALRDIGPREAGTPGNARARAYLRGRFEALGYTVRDEPFRYARHQDYGSHLVVGGARIAARALHATTRTSVTAGLAWVNGTGRPEDLRRAGVRGRIAVVARGGMLFRQKALNARAAGAAALVIVNTEPGPYRGAVLEDLGLPVVSVGPEGRAALRAGGSGVLRLDVRPEVTEGVNLVASRPGVRPEVLFGAHHDSFIGSPGLNDNGSGVVAVLDVARAVRDTPLESRAVFVLFDGEEDRFQGSRAYVKAHPDVIRGLRGMLSLDMVGVAAAPLAVGGSASLVTTARAAVPTLGRFADAGLSDHESFMAAGVPGLLLFRGLDPNYHLPSDTRVDPDLVSATADVAVRIARTLLRLP